MLDKYIFTDSVGVANALEEHYNYRGEYDRGIVPIEKIVQFTQTWGSTSLGFPGRGCARMTTAITSVIYLPGGHYDIWFDDQYAYPVNNPTEKFFEDIRNHKIADVKSAKEKYEQQ